MSELMKPLFSLGALLLLVAPLGAQESPLAEVSAEQTVRCTPANDRESGRYSSEREGAWPTALMPAEFERTYAESKRLSRRIFYAPEASEFLSGEDYARGLPSGSASPMPPRIPKRFLMNMVRHIEAAISAGYAQWVMWEDMGHGHIFIPQDLATECSQLSAGARIERILSDERTLVLYHTAEEIDLRPGANNPPDPAVRFRLENRNVVGDNHEGAIFIRQNWEGPSTNTVRQIPGYVEITDMLLILQAHRDGCFTYRDGSRQLRFDVRL
jgi:hypothetical protein